MARTLLTATLAPGSDAATGTVLPFTAADVANMNAVVLTGKEILIAFNSDVGSHNITVTSAPDRRGRLGHLTEAIAAGVYRMYGEKDLEGWLQTDGRLYFQADHATVLFAIIRHA